MQLSFRARGTWRYLTNASARYGKHDTFPRALFYALVARCCLAIKSRNLPSKIFRCYRCLSKRAIKRLECVMRKRILEHSYRFPVDLFTYFKTLTLFAHACQRSLTLCIMKEICTLFFICTYINLSTLEGLFSRYNTIDNTDYNACN